MIADGMGVRKIARHFNVYAATIDRVKNSEVNFRLRCADLHGLWWVLGHGSWGYEFGSNMSTQYDCVLVGELCSLRPSSLSQ